MSENRNVSTAPKSGDGKEQILNTVKIEPVSEKIRLLPLAGRDQEGNLYQVDNVSFLKNGRRFLPVMGEFHFSRYEPEDWEEELLKMRAGGVNILATYVFWIHHEEREGEWDFTGCRDLKRFLAICRKIKMPVWLRIGPWAHGECRNGGFPDWVVSGAYEVRSNDPAYLALVKQLFAKISEQAKGQMCRDGGPVLGIQLENEYGCCGGPSDRTLGEAHLLTLKKLALEAGLAVPYYTATGWGGAYVVQDEMIPVLGGYVDAPWAEHVKEMPASENFLFVPYQQDENIGADLKERKREELHFDIHQNPYLTAELGGGLQPTSHRRTYPWPADIAAQALCVLGSGANLLGYYMYHGGINPEGKDTTLQESRATGYNNDLPLKSYDFQTCIRESGEIGESFGRLKRLHLLLADFGELLAGAVPYFPVLLPQSAEDEETLRVSARVNREAGVGFLFLNNHQRKRKMKDHSDFSVLLTGEAGDLLIPHLSVKSGECKVIPFRCEKKSDSGKVSSATEMPAGGKTVNGAERPVGEMETAASVLPARTNTSLLCRIGSRGFYYTDEEIPFFEWATKPGETEPAAPNGGSDSESGSGFSCEDDVPAENYVVLTADEADRAFRVGTRLYVTEHRDSCLIGQESQNELFLLTKAPAETLTIYGADGPAVTKAVETEAVSVTAEFQQKAEVTDQEGALFYREYEIHLGKIPENQIHQLYLAVDYLGDRAEVYQKGRLVDDWFTTGEIWHFALKRLGYPETLTIRVYASDHPISNPYDNQVYYDRVVEKGCEIRQVEALPEYKIKVV